MSASVPLATPTTWADAGGAGELLLEGRDLGTEDEAAAAGGGEQRRLDARAQRRERRSGVEEGHGHGGGG